MDTFYFGRRGSGKTLRSVIDVLVDWYEGRQIWTNTELHSFFDTNYITKKKGNLFKIDATHLIELLLEDSNIDSSIPKTLLLDEIKTQANSRQFSSYINRNLTNFVSQARKLNFRIIYTDQIPKSYDSWIRQMTEKIVSCQAITDINDIGLGTNDYPEPLYFGYAEMIIDNMEDKPKVYWISRNTARHFYPLYKTETRITPLELKYSSEKE